MSTLPRRRHVIVTGAGRVVCLEERQIFFDLLRHCLARDDLVTAAMDPAEACEE